MKNKRDNFTPAVKQKLRERAGNKCSNPNCRNITTGPGEGIDKVLHVGDAAHICAASPEGPRYDSSMTPEERKSIRNGIWLCTLCSRLIDHKYSDHPIELLHDWKNQAEALATSEIGKAAIDKTTVSKEVAAILTGTPSLSTDIISNAHKSATTALEALDPRFTVNSRYENKKTTFEISTNKDVKVNIKIESTPENNFQEKITRLFEEGEDLTIPGSAIISTGSPLLDHVMIESNKNGGTGTLQFSAPRNKTIIKIHLEDDNGQRIQEIDDIHGYYQAGFKSVRFEGDIFDNILSLSMKIHVDEVNFGKLTINPNFNAWENVEVSNLPNYEEALEFFRNLANGKKIVLRIKHKGKVVIHSNPHPFEMREMALESLSLFRYIDKCVQLSRIINKNIYYKKCSISEEEYKQLMDYTSQGLPALIHKADTLPEGKIESTIIINDDLNNLEAIKKHNTPSNLKIKELSNSTILVFGQEILIPKKILNFNGVTPRIKEIFNSSEDEKSAVIEWIPSDDFYWTVDYSYDE